MLCMVWTRSTSASDRGHQYRQQVALESLAFQNVGASIHACEAIAELVTDASPLRCVAKQCTNLT